MSQDKGRKIVVTGGPGGGKTTAVDLFRRELGDAIVVVPEAATLLFAGGFPRVAEKDAIKVTQNTIYQVQKNLEDLVHSVTPERILLCDRGTIDGVAYWPGGSAEFFGFIDSTSEKEFERYDAVVYFESAAVGGLSINGNNPIRTESIEEAMAIEKRMYAAWSKHPNFEFIPHQKSFLSKIQIGLEALKKFANINNKLGSK